MLFFFAITTTWGKQLKSLFWLVAHLGRENMVTGAGICRSRCIYNQEAENKQEVEGTTSRQDPLPNGPLPAVKLQTLKGISTFPNHASCWGSRVQMHELVGNPSHSNHIEQPAGKMDNLQGQLCKVSRERMLKRIRRKYQKPKQKVRISIFKFIFLKGDKMNIVLS